MMIVMFASVSFNIEILSQTFAVKKKDHRLSNSRTFVFADFATLLASASLAIAACFLAPTAALADGLVTSDVALFFNVYDAANGRPNAEQLQSGYLDKGSAAVREFTPHRIVSAANLAEIIQRDPATYTRARECATEMQQAAPAANESVAKLSRLYAGANRPQVSIVVGAGNSGGTIGPSGAIIGLEVVCRADAADPAPIRERLSIIVAHEVAHTQQKGFRGDSLLALSLTEGVAELLAELTAGRRLNIHLSAWTKGRDAQLNAKFLAERSSNNYKEWLYNGIGDAKQPGDLGYLMGYRIARAYYDRSPDKRAAIKRLLEETDAESLLHDSGWAE